ncbi:MAG: DUF3313 family protein [Casimicrobiaceae bacterium]
MKIRSWFTVLVGVALLADATFAAAQSAASPGEPDAQGLVKLRSNAFDAVLVRPGIDFRGYIRIMIDPTQAALAGDWLRNLNTPPLAIMRRTTAQDAEQIVDQTRRGFGSTFADAVTRAGYEVVSAPGPDVLRLSPRIFDLRVNAPASLTNAPATRVYTVSAGEATLALDIRDSTTGELLGRVVDHRTAGQRGSTRSSVRFTSSATNRFDFGNMFDAWSSGWVDTLADLKVKSPVKTAELTPLH